jgi:hypothetical protein
VSWNKNSRKWVATLRVHGKFHRLGLFDTAEGAARARAAALSHALSETDDELSN